MNKKGIMETKDENNKVSEPELAYGQRRKTVDEMVEAIRRDHPRMYAAIPNLREELERLEHPRPMTRKEAQERIARIQAEIDAGEPGMTLEEFQAEMEEEYPELKHIRL